MIDEAADLFLSDKSTERSVVQLAQKGRAAGMHLVLATQRPSVDVLTGLVKANFPSRACFRVSTGVDSRVVLDEEGAQALLGKGDMLYKSAQTTELIRLQTPFVAQGTIERMLSEFKATQ